MKNFANTFRFTFISAVLTMFLAGCGSTGGPYRDTREFAPDTVQIVIFRPDTFFQGGIPYQVNLNGKESAILRNGGFAVITIQPGKVQIEVRSANRMQALFRNPTLSLNGTAKDRLFVRATPQRGNTVALDVISESDAKRELISLKESQ